LSDRGLYIYIYIQLYIKNVVIFKQNSISSRILIYIL